jgi:hypothetical protein
MPNALFSNPSADFLCEVDITECDARRCKTPRVRRLAARIQLLNIENATSGDAITRSGVAADKEMPVGVILSALFWREA